MEGRVWAMLAAFLFIACFAGGVSYLFEIDSKRDALNRALNDVKNAQEAVVNTQRQAETARESLEKAEEVQKLFAKKSELKAAIEDLRKRRTAAVDAYKKSVQDLRALAIGTSWPEFTRGSQTIRNARIQKITETEVTFAHDEGVAKLSGDALPEAARERFRIEMFPMLPEAPPTPLVTEAALLQSSQATTFAADPIASAAPGPPTTPDGASTIAKLQIEIEANEQKISTLNRNRQEWLTRARSYRQQATVATMNGRPAYAFNQQAQQAEQNADLCIAHIERLNRQNVELKRRQVEPSTVAAP